MTGTHSIKNVTSHCIIFEYLLVYFTLFQGLICQSILPHSVLYQSHCETAAKSRPAGRCGASPDLVRLVPGQPPAQTTNLLFCGALGQSIQIQNSDQLGASKSRRQRSTNFRRAINHEQGHQFKIDTILADLIYIRFSVYIKRKKII